MFSVFDQLAAERNEERETLRTASVVATARAEDRFTAFLDASVNADERQWRVAYIEDDLRAVVAAACLEHEASEADQQLIFDSLHNRFAKGAFCDECRKWGDACTCEKEKDGEKDEKDEDPADSFDKELEGKESRSRTASVREARRPKLCPYHSEVVDISLAAGDPQAGFNTMAQHAWGQNHCKGDFEGSCNFKRQMVTQKYWDDKTTEYAERARQRAEQPPQPAPFEAPPAIGESAETDMDLGGPDISESLSDAPSAVGAGEDMGSGVEPSMAVAAASEDAGDRAQKREKLPAGDARDTFATGLDGEPSGPKLDRTQWKPNALNPSGNLPEIETEGAGSPNPTTRQDITSPAEYENYSEVDLPGLVERQDVTQGSETERNVEQPHTDTWSGSDSQATPVTTEVQSNSVLQRLESQGFTPRAQALAAIAAYERRA